MLTGYPKVNGLVGAVISDNSGGYFIGGSFSSVGGLRRSNLAHIRSDGRVDENWTAGTDSPVWALARFGDYILVGGQFTVVALKKRVCLAWMNADGTLAEINPSVDGIVACFAVDGDKVYLGGLFQNINAVPRTGVACLDQEGQVTQWAPSVENIRDGHSWPNSIAAIATNEDSVYVSGSFSRVNGKNRNKIACIDKSGAVTDWNPDANNGVVAIAVDGPLVYVGGYFTRIGGKNRNHLACLEPSGMASPWNPAPNKGVRKILIDGSRLVVVGAFSKIAGSSRTFVAALDRSGRATEWNPGRHILKTEANHGYAIELSGKSAYIGLFD